MAVSKGDKLPDVTVLRMGADGPEQVQMADLTKGRVAIFGLPGAFTGTCSNAHMPSFIRTADAFRAKGFDAIYCVTVNDPFVCAAWAEATGSDKAGIAILADAAGDFTRAMGLAFDAPPAGLFGRSKRYALAARDGVIEVIQIEDSPGMCSVSAGESLLEAV